MGTDEKVNEKSIEQLVSPKKTLSGREKACSKAFSWMWELPQG